MKPSSRRILQISAFSLELGTSTRSCLARCAFRIRISRSETGSMLLISISLPARLDHAREISLPGEVAKADAAQTELPHEATRTSAPLAPVALPNLELQGDPGLRHSGRSRHLDS